MFLDLPKNFNMEANVAMDVRREKEARKREATHHIMEGGMSDEALDKLFDELEDNECQ